jgi:hypothetical protein
LVIAGLIVMSSIYSCSETGKANPVNGKPLKVAFKTTDKPSCCASGIPARFPVKSAVGN